MKNDKESTVLKEVKKFLIENNIFFMRLHTIGLPGQFGMIKDILAIGRSDLIGFHKGLFFAIETKSATGEQRLAQELFEKRITLARGKYYRIRDDEGIQQLKNDLKLTEQ